MNVDCGIKFFFFFLRHLGLDQILNIDSSGGFWSVNRASSGSGGLAAAGGSTAAGGETTTVLGVTANGLFFVLLLVGKGVFLRPNCLVGSFLFDQVRHSRALGPCLSSVALGFLEGSQPTACFCFSEFCVPGLSFVALGFVKVMQPWDSFLVVSTPAIKSWAGHEGIGKTRSSKCALGWS